MSKRLQTVAESLYGLPQPLVKQASDPILAKRDPTVNDTGYPLAQLWLNTVSDTLWDLVDVSAGVATWALLASSGGALNTLTGDDAIPILPNAGNINIQGGAAGAIAFTSGGLGQMDAAVQVDGTTITIVGNQLVASGALPVQYFSLTTIGAVTATTADIALPNNQVSQVLTNIAYVDSLVTVGGGAFISGGVIEQAGVFSLLNIVDDISINESGALAASDYAYIAGGGASTMAVQVTGVAGFTINWRVAVTIISTP